MAKVLIIKLGYSETLDSEIGKVPSLGDVLRTTVVLHLFNDAFVTWLVDERAYPFLKDNRCIARILVYNEDLVSQIQSEQFDTIINFEKDPDICALSNLIKAKRRYGFRLDEKTGKSKYCEGSEDAFRICNDLKVKRHNKKYWQQVIMEVAGGEWNGQEYILGYKPKTKLKCDVGLNWTVGAKWPNKAWPKECWDKLAKLLEGHYTYSWQEGLNNVNEYIEWINSCRLVVTADSLGQHIAVALKRKVLILYGPTNPHETYLYGLGEKLLPEINYDCIPCLKNKCIYKKSCMYFITPERVAKEITVILGKKE